MYTVYILSKTFGRPGKKNVYVFTSPLLCRHHLCHLEGSTKMKVDNWLLKNLFKVPRLREYMGKKQWKQQMKTKIIVFCVYVPYLFWWNNVPDSVCVCPVDWFGKCDYIYIYSPIFTSCSVGNRGTMELRGFLNGIVHNWWAAEVLSRLECIVTLAYLMHKICMNCDYLSAIDTIYVRLKCLQLDKLSVPSRKESFSNLFLEGVDGGKVSLLNQCWAYLPFT